jgi:hypothetical protein
MMPQKDCVTAATPGDLGKEFVARHASCRFHRLLRFTGQRGHIDSLDLELAIELCRQAFDESRVGPARGTAQLMIEMADNVP